MKKLEKEKKSLKETLDKEIKIAEKRLREKEEKRNNQKNQK